MNMYQQPILQPGPEDARKIAETLGLQDLTLNEVDFDDVFVTEDVLKVLHHVAKTIASKETTPDYAPKMSAYWVEDSMELVLCAASSKDMHLVRVPHDHWAMRPCTVH